MQMKLWFFTGVISTLTLVGVALPSWCETSEGLNFITQLSGDVKVKPPSQNNFQHARRFQLLSSRALLKLGPKASATVMCGDLSYWKVPAGKISRVSDPKACPLGVATLVRPNSSRTPTRPAGLTEAALRKIPYIISPRSTLILKGRPITLRWNAVSGATHYTVTVEDWKEETSNTEIVYPRELKKDPDYSYFVSVKADNGASSELEGVDVFFKVLDDTTAGAILAAAEKIKQEKLSKEAEGLALAYLYRGKDLNEEAIEVLESLVQTGNQPMVFYQLLGDIYRQVGLNILSKERYEKALQLATAEGDVEGKALAQTGLGEVEYAMGNGNEAVTLLEEAKAGYAVLGDQDQVQQLAKRINSFLGR